MEVAPTFVLIFIPGPSNEGTLGAQQTGKLLFVLSRVMMCILGRSTTRAIGAQQAGTSGFALSFVLFFYFGAIHHKDS